MVAAEISAAYNVEYWVGSLLCYTSLCIAR